MRATPAVLAPGAFACVLIAWALDPEDPAERPRKWLEGSGCDAFLLHTSTDDPIETATVWNRDLLDRPEAYAEALDRWLAYYRELGIGHLGYACVVVRKRGRRSGRLARGAAAAARRSAPGGDTCESSSRCTTVCPRSTRAGGLLDRRLRVVDDAVVTQDTRFAKAAGSADSLTLRLETGLPFSAELDPPTARLVRGLDGSRTLDEALAAAAGDRARAETGLSLARRMLEVGFLEFAD